LIQVRIGQRSIGGEVEGSDFVLVVAYSTEVAWREGSEVFEVRGVDIALSEGVGLIIYAKMKRNRLQPRSLLSGSNQRQ